ncbi:MAG TPA: glycosyltransferase family 39 protein [Pirellulales bacterium]
MWHVAIAFVIVMAAVIRLWAAIGDLWLDEIWSYGLANLVDSPWKIFTQIRHDNNHHLMSVWIYHLGIDGRSLVARAPSLVAGIGTILLAAQFARRWGQREMLAAAVLTANSYVMINYSSEARGYALAGFFAIAAFLVLERSLDTRHKSHFALFWLLVVLGFLSHLTFLHFYCGALAWSALRSRRESGTWRKWIALMARCHAVPVAFLIAFYFSSVQGMEIGGGDRPSTIVVILKAMSLAVGGTPRPSTDQLLIAFLATGGGIAAIVSLFRGKSELWALFLTTIYLSPLFLLIEQPRSGLFVRYFYINILFYLLLISYLLGRLSLAGSPGTFACLALTASIMAGNVSRLREFSDGRRGEYLAAVRYIVDHSTEPEVEVGVDHARTRLVLHFYSGSMAANRTLKASEAAPAPSPQDEWYITHQENPAQQPAPEIQDTQGETFELAQVFRHSGLSGFDWALYHRVLPGTTDGTK